MTLLTSLLLAHDGDFAGFSTSGENFAVAEFTADTSGGTQQFRDSSITNWEFALVIASGTTTADTHTTHARITVGFVNAAGNMRVVGRRAEDGNTARSETYHWPRTTSCLLIGDPTDPTSPGPVAELGFSAAATDGFDGTWLTTPDQAYRITIVFWGQITSSEVGTTQATTTPSTTAEYDYPLILPVGTAASANAQSDYTPGMGVAVNDGTPTQGSLFGEWNRLVTTSDSDSAIYNNRASGRVVTGTESPVQVTAFSATPDFTAQTDSGTASFFWAGIRHANRDRNYGVALETLPGSTGTEAFTGLGFQPAVLLGAASLLTSENTLTDGPTASTEAIFAGDHLTQACHTASHEEGVVAPTPTNANTRSTSEALVLYDHQGTIASEATLDSLDATGFTLDFSTATAGRLLVFGLEVTKLEVSALETVELSETASALEGLMVSALESLELSESASVATVEISTMGTTLDSKLATARPGLYRANVARPDPDPLTISRPGLYRGHTAGPSIESQPG